MDLLPTAWRGRPLLAAGIRLEPLAFGIPSSRFGNRLLKRIERLRSRLRLSSGLTLSSRLSILKMRLTPRQVRNICSVQQMLRPHSLPRFNPLLPPFRRRG